MAPGLETLDIDVEDADAVGVALLGVTAQELLADADAQHGLLQRADDLVQPSCPQVAAVPRHRR